MLLGVSRGGWQMRAPGSAPACARSHPVPKRGVGAQAVYLPPPGPVLARRSVTAGTFPCTPPSRDGVMARYQLPPSTLTRAEQRDELESRAGTELHRARRAVPRRAVLCRAMPSAVPVLCRHAGDAPSTDAHENPRVQSSALPAKPPGTVLPAEPALLRHRVQLGREFPRPARAEKRRGIIPCR